MRNVLIREYEAHCSLEDAYFSIHERLLYLYTFPFPACRRHCIKFALQFYAGETMQGSARLWRALWMVRHGADSSAIRQVGSRKWHLIFLVTGTWMDAN